MAHTPPQRPIPSQPPHARLVGPPTLATAAGAAAGAAVPRPGFSASLSRWLRVSSAAGLVISAAFHLVILSVAAVIVLAHAGNADEDGGGGAPVQFAVLNESELAELAGGQLETDAPAVPDAPESELPEIDIQVPETVGLDAMRESLESTAGGTGAGDISTGGDGLGGPGTGGGAGGGGAGFFGIEATGSRFAYVIDVSGSMAVGGKMEAMTSELLRSINAMLDQHKFMVVPFSSDAAPLGGRTGWMEASDAGKSWARRAAMDLQAVGGTNPSPGFFYVFSQTPKPDAIYFLTDGEFNPVVVQEIAGLNAEHDVTIHTICFGTRDAEPVMKRIAEQSGGNYTFVPVGGVP